MKKRYFFLAIIISIAVLVIFNLDLLKYATKQGLGQANVLYSSVSINQILENPEAADSIKSKIKFIQDVKKFAEDSLGLEKTESYSSYYEQNNKPILWVVTASPPFKIEAYKWKFPIAGEFSYKGFFDFEEAQREQFNMKLKGYDTQLNEVNAWSTLGWFNDPILSSMLKKSKPALADLIIHELTHATIYLKDSVQLNENLASFIAKKGTEIYFQNKIEYKEEYAKYLERSIKKSTYRNRVKAYMKTLNTLYNSFDENSSYENKVEMKKQLMAALKYDMLSRKYNKNQEKIEQKMKTFELNNAYFSGFNTYRAKENSFEKEYNSKFNRNLKDFIEYYKALN